MNKDSQKRRAEAFRQRHHAPPLLLLPNAWDAMSARVFEAAGFDVIATTSGGVAWALGFPDGEKTPWAEVVAATERIVRTVRVPVTADIEGGYGESPNQVADSVAEIIRTGVVGINLEDSTPRDTVVFDQQPLVHKVLEYVFERGGVIPDDLVELLRRVSESY